MSHSQQIWLLRHGDTEWTSISDLALAINTNPGQVGNSCYIQPAIPGKEIGWTCTTPADEGCSWAWISSTMGFWDIVAPPPAVPAQITCEAMANLL